MQEKEKGKARRQTDGKENIAVSQKSITKGAERGVERDGGKEELGGNISEAAAAPTKAASMNQFPGFSNSATGRGTAEEGDVRA